MGYFWNYSIDNWGCNHLFRNTKSMGRPSNDLLASSCKRRGWLPGIEMDNGKFPGELVPGDPDRARLGERVQQTSISLRVISSSRGIFSDGWIAACREKGFWGCFLRINNSSRRDSHFFLDYVWKRLSGSIIALIVHTLCHNSQFVSNSIYNTI